MEERNAYRLAKTWCSALTLISLSILLPNPLSVIFGVLIVVASSASQERWQHWCYIAYPFFVLGSIYQSFLVMGSIGLTIFGIVQLTGTKRDPAQLSWGICGLVIGPIACLLAILQILFSYRAYTNCNYLFDVTGPNPIDPTVQVIRVPDRVSGPSNLLAQQPAQYVDPYNQTGQAPYPPAYPQAQARNAYQDQSQGYYPPQNPGYYPPQVLNAQYAYAPAPAARQPSQ